MSAPEDLMDIQLKAAGIPTPEREYHFHDKRRWRFDFAWPNHLVALEVEGGTFAHGRHTRGAGFAKDCEKYNSAAIMGWKVLRVTPAHINSGYALRWVESLLGVPAD